MAESATGRDGLSECLYETCDTYRRNQYTSLYLLSSLFAQWTLNDYGALIGIILGIGTFLVNCHYKQQSAQAQKARWQR
ncbi:HP1 family phage holin [Salmonella enterica]|uniref:HP1 family phage holin n=1 Tax=Salmonella enterica TaxID=28901 RepID=UPI001E4E95D2|nr:HP1 family phage holin [Salmonella enterica]